MLSFTFLRLQSRVRCWYTWSTNRIMRLLDHEGLISDNCAVKFVNDRRLSEHAILSHSCEGEKALYHDIELRLQHEVECTNDEVRIRKPVAAIVWVCWHQRAARSLETASRRLPCHKPVEATPQVGGQAITKRLGLCLFGIGIDCWRHCVSLPKNLGYSSCAFARTSVRI